MQTLVKLVKIKNQMKERCHKTTQKRTTNGQYKWGKGATAQVN